MSSKFDLFLELFPHCNLNCKFCHQRTIAGYAEHYTQTIRLPKEHYVNLALQRIKEQGIISHDLNMIGGELFYDKSQPYVTSMRALIDYLNPSSIACSTNLIFNVSNNELFNYFLDRGEFIVCASYNPLNRYSSEKQVELFTKNVKSLYLPMYQRGAILSLEVVLQPEFLKLECALPLLDWVAEVNKVFDKPLIDVIFIVDYRGYPEDCLSNFNAYLYAFLKRYPTFSNVRNLHLEKRVCKNKNGCCYKPNAKVLSYTNGFRYHGCSAACIDQDADIFAVANKMERVYGCKSCQYNDVCVNRCPVGLSKAGLLKDGQPCYYKFLFDHYAELTKC